MFQELLSKKDFPADVEGSRRLIEEHTQLKKKVSVEIPKIHSPQPVAIVTSPPDL